MALDPRFFYACDINYDLKTLLQDKGTVFSHPVGIVISKHAEIGKQCWIYQNVTIGAKSIKDGLNNKYPRIGNNVVIYAGAVVIGDIYIGNNAIIGANSVVMKNVPDYCVVAGNPAVRIGINIDAVEHAKQSYLIREKKFLHDMQTIAPVMELRSDSICIDCGATIGNFTNIFAKKGATVYAFEPHPVCHKKLVARFADNPKVIISDKGVLDRDSQMKLFRSALEAVDEDLFTQSSSIYISKMNVDPDSYYQVELIDLISFIQKIGKPIDILKLDVEGAEFCILERVIKEGIHNNINHILVEAYDDRIPEIMQSAKKVRALIHEMNIDNIKFNWI